MAGVDWAIIIAAIGLVGTFIVFVFARIDRFNDKQEAARNSLRDEFKKFESEIRPRLHVMGNELQRLIGESEAFDKFSSRIEGELRRLNDAVDAQPNRIIDMWRAARAEMK